MKAAANAAPLIILAKLGILDILARLYELVTIPSAVHDEAVITGLATGRPDAQAIQLAIVRGSIVVVRLDDAELDADIAALTLGRGEKQAMHVARRESTDRVLLDDLAARQAAVRLGLRAKGTLGVIVDAFRAGYLTGDERDFLFESLIQREDVWISEALVRRVWDALRQTG